MTIQALWRGNSSPGQTVDESGYGHDLFEVAGASPWPSSPTPPEGDKWLRGGVVPDHINLLQADFLLAKNEGVLECFFKAGSSGAFHYFFDMVDGGLTYDTFIEPWANRDDGSSTIGVDYTKDAGGYGFISVAAPEIEDGAAHRYRVEWDSFGVRLYLDGVLKGSLSSQVGPLDLFSYFPGQSMGANGFIDYVMLGDQASDQAPSLGSDVAAVASSRARRR